MKKLVLAGLLMINNLAVADEDIIELGWRDLKPACERHDLYNRFEGHVRSDTKCDHSTISMLSGKLVTLSGFIVPIDGDKDLITRFILVPHFKSCLHMPPPSSNQTVMVDYSDGLKINEVDGAVSVTGNIYNTKYENKDWNASYRIDALILGKNEEYDEVIKSHVH